MTKNFLRRYLKLALHKALRKLSLLFPLALVSLVMFTLVFISRSTPTPAVVQPPVAYDPSPTAPPPPVTAERVIVLDPDSDTVMYQKSADEPVAPASTTKLMTALVAMDQYPLNHTITVSESFTEGQDIGLEPGEHITVEQLIYATLIQSGNDAAEILAREIPGGRVEFVAKMNSKAQSLYLHHTSFKNPTGLDEFDHYSSAADLARLAASVLKNDFLRRIVASENAVVTSHVLTNTNKLLSEVPGVLGVKTGFTDAAGEALVTYVDRPAGKRLIVILRSSDRFSDTKSLIDWSYATD